MSHRQLAFRGQITVLDSTGPNEPNTPFYQNLSTLLLFYIKHLCIKGKKHQLQIIFVPFIQEKKIVSRFQSPRSLVCEDPGLQLATTHLHSPNGNLNFLTVTLPKGSNLRIKPVALKSHCKGKPTESKSLGPLNVHVLTSCYWVIVPKRSHPLQRHAGNSCEVKGISMVYLSRHHEACSRVS